MKLTFTRRHLLTLAGLGGAAALAQRTGLLGLSPAEAAPAPEPFALNLPAAEWRKRLTPEQFRILREAGTERPYTSPLNDEHRSGTFHCAGCAQALFDAATKFDSHTGWPSFYRPLPKAVVEREDLTLGMVRTEVLCHRCGGHLGHVFDDGPAPTGLRYCMNGVALQFTPA